MPDATTVLTQVRIFDGEELHAPGTVVIQDGLIAAVTEGPAGSIGDRAADRAGAGDLLDCGGAVLLPGLIDAHIHLTGDDVLRLLADHGVTTGLDMGTWPPARVDSFRNAVGDADIRSSGAPAAAPGGVQSHMPGFPPESLLTGPEQAEQYVTRRIAEGADYIKVIAERPGTAALDQATLDALVRAAHAHGKRVIAHAAAADAVESAQQAGVDVVTHAPLDRPLDDAAVARMVADGRICVPTLTMMEGVARNLGHLGLNYDAARASVTAMHRAGVPILAGTDANTAPGAPAAVPHGSSLHRELELLVEAGLSTREALRAATVLPARYFGLADRGVIAPGLRADLVLIDGDPLADITATTRIARVWCAGIAYHATPHPS